MWICNHVITPSTIHFNHYSIIHLLVGEESVLLKIFVSNGNREVSGVGSSMHCIKNSNQFDS